MSRHTQSLVLSLPLARSVTIATLMGATFLMATLTSVRAEPTAPPKSLAAAETTSDKGETVEQRITNLHAALNIVPGEEAKWNAVAQTMRENAASMDKLVVEKRAKLPQNMTALDDLMTYREFAQAHVDGLKNLTSAFRSLYESMPDAQKKNADEVFENFGRKGGASHS